MSLRDNSILVIVHRMDSLSTPMLLEVYYESLAEETHKLENRLLNVCWILQSYETALAVVLTVLTRHNPQNQCTPENCVDEVQILLHDIQTENELLSSRLKALRIKKPAHTTGFVPGELRQAIETYKAVCEKIRDIEKLKATIKSMKKARVKPARHKRCKKKEKVVLKEISLNRAKNTRQQKSR